MRLPDFIEDNVEEILLEWTEFARVSAPEPDTLDLDALRDHAAEILQAISVDLRTPQTADERDRKSKGFGILADTTTAAEYHGAERAAQGFSCAAMVAEFRALRASVVRLYQAAKPELTVDDAHDLTRFHEAVDQALAESVLRFTHDLDQSKDTLIAVLGHDLRTPLSTVLMVTEYLRAVPCLDDAQRALAQRAVRSASRMKGMLDDLRDFTQTRIGNGIGITTYVTNLADVLQHAVEEIDTIQPSTNFDVRIDGDMLGVWDGPRLGQAITNLLGNAVQHGDTTRPIVASASGDSDEVVVEVYNHGPVIPAADIPRLFSPFKRLAQSARGDHHMGLGLYITERIVTAHGGRIAVSSSLDDGTRFRLTLPRVSVSGQRADSRLLTAASAGDPC